MTATEQQNAQGTTQQSQPLQGWHVVVTRSEEQADSLSERLRALGAEPVAYPTIAFAPPEDEQALDDALRRLLAGGYDWLVLTSVTGVKAVHERLERLRAEQRPSSITFKVAVVGAATATACADLLGMEPAIVPEKFVAEALAEALHSLGGQRVLLAQAELARPILRDHLQQIGAHLDTVIAYRTVPASGGADVPAMLARGELQAITFTSGSTVRSFVQRIGPDALPLARQTVLACIGPVTAQTAEEVGLSPHVVAETSTVDGLVAALIDWKQRNA